MKKILIVVDMQNDFIDGSLGTEEAVEIVDKVVDKIEKYHQENNVVVATLDTHFYDYESTYEGKNIPRHCVAETYGWKLHGKIADMEHTKCIKTTFGGLDLRQIVIDALGYSPQGVDYKIEICGLCTDICVITNALLLRTWFPDAIIKVDASCCAGTTPVMHDEALDVMRSCLIEVINDG